GGRMPENMPAPKLGEPDPAAMIPPPPPAAAPSRARDKGVGAQPGLPRFAENQAAAVPLASASVASAAAATELGEFFQYAIKQPVTLPRQKSALIPIV